MLRKIKRRYTIPIFIVLCIGMWGWVNITRTVPATQTLKEVVTLGEDIPLDTINKNRFESLDQYIEKPFVLKGVIELISLDESYNLVLVLKDGIRASCKFQKDQNKIMSMFHTGDTIQVKGIYKGALDYLVLQNCIRDNDK